MRLYIKTLRGVEGMKEAHGKKLSSTGGGGRFTAAL